MLVELTNREIMLLQMCVEYCQLDYKDCEELFLKYTCAYEYYNDRMSEMSVLIKKLSEVINA